MTFKSPMNVLPCLHRIWLFHALAQVRSAPGKLKRQVFTGCGDLSPLGTSELSIFAVFFAKQAILIVRLATSTSTVRSTSYIFVFLLLVPQKCGIATEFNIYLCLAFRVREHGLCHLR